METYPKHSDQTQSIKAAPIWAQPEKITCITSRAAAHPLLSCLISTPGKNYFGTIFFTVIAETPDRADLPEKMKNYGEHLYKKLSDKFNLEALRKSDWRLEISPPGEDDYGTRFGDEGSSPIRHMKYSDFFREFGTPLGLDTGYHFCGDKETHWLADPENYDHIHQMAKRNAIGALTLDVCDTAGCAELAEWLEGKDIKLDIMYLSNVGHYLDWDNETIKECTDDPKKEAKDFCGRTILTNQWTAAAANLKTLTHRKTKIIRFDDCPGESRFSQFQPLFKTSENPDKIEFPTPDMESGLIPERVHS